MKRQKKVNAPFDQALADRILAEARRCNVMVYDIVRQPGWAPDAATVTAWARQYPEFRRQIEAQQVAVYEALKAAGKLQCGPHAPNWPKQQAAA